MELCRILELWAILAITYFNPLILQLRKGTLELTFSKLNSHLEAELGIEPKSPDLNVLSTSPLCDNQDWFFQHVFIK